MNKTQHFALKVCMLASAACITTNSSAGDNDHQRWGAGLSVPIGSGGLNFGGVSLVVQFQDASVHSGNRVGGLQTQFSLSLPNFTPTLSIFGLAGGRCVQGAMGVGITDFFNLHDAKPMFPVAIKGPYSSLGLNNIFGKNFSASPFIQADSLGCFDSYESPAVSPPPPPPPPSGSGQVMALTFIQYASIQDQAGFEVA